MTTPPVSPQGHPSASDQMRLRLAEDRLNEMRQMDLGETGPAELILLAERLGNSLEDLIKMVRRSPAGS